MDNLVTVWKFLRLNWELGTCTKRTRVHLQELYWELGTGEDLNEDWYANQILKEFLPQYPVPSPLLTFMKKNWDLRSAL